MPLRAIDSESYVAPRAHLTEQAAESCTPAARSRPARYEITIILQPAGDNLAIARFGSHRADTCMPMHIDGKKHAPMPSRKEDGYTTGLQIGILPTVWQVDA